MTPETDLISGVVVAAAVGFLVVMLQKEFSIEYCV